MKKPLRVAFYGRVSMNKQAVENQLRVLRKVAERHGWDVVYIFVDEGISGSKGREKRPGFDALCKAISRKEIDMVAATSVDRLSRSLLDLVSFLQEIHAKGVDLYLDKQGLDTSTPMGKAMFQVCGVFAELERLLIQERVNDGLERARAEGKKLGRPKASKEREEAVVKARMRGEAQQAIATKLKMGVGTVRRVLKENGLLAGLGWVVFRNLL